MVRHWESILRDDRYFARMPEDWLELKRRRPWLGFDRRFSSRWHKAPRARTADRQYHQGGLLRADLNDELREKGAVHAVVTN